MTLVAGIDSSTQSCKVLVCDAATGEVVREGQAAHPDGTEIDPAAWQSTAHEAIANAGGLDGVDALAVGAQQHGMVCLDATGRVVRPALLWNDVRSADAARALVRELGGRGRGPRPSVSCRWPRSPWRSCAGSPTTSHATPTAPRPSACPTTG